MGVEIVDNRPEDETRAAPVEDVEEVQIDDKDPSRKTQIGTLLSPKERAELIAFLRANNDVFAWTLANMPGIPTSVSQDKLSTNPLKKLVAQKRRLFWGERLQVIKEEVEKLLQAGFVRRVDYCEWVANLVLVKKANEDEEKTSFYAGDEIYCYVMMPFGLKNAELRYPIAEKAELAVVTSAKKLRPYIQSHPIIVLTDQPLQQILQKLECSGRLIKWAVELGEFEITFQQRSVIRAQALADFLVECTPCHSTPNPEPNDWTLYVDGASSCKGSGAGALLIGPDGYRSEHALKFNFDATNNMAEYKALLLGLQLALELKVMAIQIYTLVAELKCKFQKFCLNKIPRTKDEQADSLSKFASDSSLSSRSVFVEVLDEPSFMKPRMMEISTDPDTLSLTDPIISFLQDGTVPEDKQEAMRLRKRASRYTLVDGVLYKRSFSLPLLRFLNPYEAKYTLRERCSKCQFFAHLTHQPADELTNLVAPWPFAQWRVDLLGPFMKGVEGVTHLIVGVDYFTKWVEARPLSNLTSKKVEYFVFGSIIYRYGIPNQIVADNGDLVLKKAALIGFETCFGKLAPNWEGPYMVAEVPHPGAYVLQDAEGKKVPRVLNINNLKNCYP
ncbi:hypothetical protein SLEP1_g59293 [Rubroshorea leprosula]|uniref:Integrase catalytic domain-containing protein n=1 Tax=Rubroshorea leprosula TaxID=152421 RepID=A0AAV5MVZ0_9ROSI|nr:hypothetical protein SLEP1_g59293 [Rubroshorea leprosula]